MRDITTKKENKKRTYTDSRPSSTPSIPNTSPPKICQADQRISTLTPAPRLIFDRLCAQEDGISSYRALRHVTGYDGSFSFTKHIQSLTRAGLAACVGVHKNRLVMAKFILCSQPVVKTGCDPAVCVQGRSLSREVGGNSAICESGPVEKKFSQEQDANWLGIGAQERRCLKCRISFLSHWAGERICSSCKESPEWQFANCYGDIGLTLDALDAHHQEASH